MVRSGINKWVVLAANHRELHATGKHIGEAIHHHERLRRQSIERTAFNGFIDQYRKCGLGFAGIT